jgi:hypothetical protein
MDFGLVQAILPLDLISNAGRSGEQPFCTMSDRDLWLSEQVRPETIEATSTYNLRKTSKEGSTMSQ